MLWQDVMEAIEREKSRGEFLYPHYERFCLSNVPSTVLSLLDVKPRGPTLPRELLGEEASEGARCVVLLLIDGFGFRQWARWRGERDGFLSRLWRRGQVSPLTTVFPSTTAAALTTLSTGLTPQEHGLPEWNVYFREVDRLIATLPFTELGDRCRDRLLEQHVDPRILFRGETIYARLRREGVSSFAFLGEAYARGAYSRLAYRGGVVVPYINLADLAVGLRKRLEREKGPAYFYVYIGDLDAVEHRYGPHTEEYHAQLSMLSHLLRVELLEKLGRKALSGTVILATSDHGQLNVKPRETVYLNRWRKLREAFQRSPRGRPIPPSGSPRDVFLHIRPDRIEETKAYLAQRLGEKATVLRADNAVREGLFGGGKPQREFLDRLGTLLILPRRNFTVWYSHVKGRRFDFLGHHGGLTRDEMLIPFAAATLSDLAQPG